MGTASTLTCGRLGSAFGMQREVRFPLIIGVRAAMLSLRATVSFFRIRMFAGSGGAAVRLLVPGAFLLFRYSQLRRYQRVFVCQTEAHRSIDMTLSLREY